MLPNENGPFATYHRDLLRDKIDMLNDRLNDNLDTVELPRELAGKWIVELRSHVRALDRYEACLRDEQTTKNRYEKERYERRLEEFRRNK